MIRGIRNISLRNFRAFLPRWHRNMSPQAQQNSIISYRRTQQTPCQKTTISFGNCSECTHKLLYAFGVTALLQFLGLAEQNEESELIQVIRKGELALLKKEYDKSEQLFHLALKIAQELQNENGITYIYDRLANIAFDTGRNEKARKLFVDVMQRLLDNGMEKDNLILIHISFKLAKIFEHIRDYQTAQIGFQYCLETLKPQLVEENPNFMDALNLWSMILNGYAYFSYYVGKFEEAFKYFQEAYQVCERIGGENGEQLILLLNNLGTVSKLRGDNDGALKYFLEAEKLGKKIPDVENFSFVYLNLAYLYLEFKFLARAREYCERAMVNAKRHEYKEGQTESEECLSKVKEALEQ